MKTNTSSLPTTGQVLGFLLKCFGESKGKGVTSPSKSETISAQYKRIERLAKQCKQSKPASKEVEAALIDAVAALFDTTLKGEHQTAKIREMSLDERIRSALPRLDDDCASENRFTVRLIFWIVYFIEHHEWLRPQLEEAYKPDDALWKWIEHAAHFYTNTLADTVRANPALLDGLPPNLTWNLPVKTRDGKVKWPVCHAVEWLESLLDDQSRKHLPGVIFPKLEESDAAMCFRRMKRGEHLLGLEKIGYIVQHPWKFRNNLAAISPEKLKAVLLWCRALQFALKKVEKNFSLDSVWLLVEWHKRATTAHIRFQNEYGKGGETK